jgi:predicted enzyme related to lactoylglutathione lyase
MPLFGKKKKEQTRPVLRGQVSEPRVERLVWLGLKVADVLAEALFLENSLQLRFANEGNSSNGHHIRYNCGGIELELVEGGLTWASRPKPKNGSPDIPLIASFAVDNIATIIENLNEKEVAVTQVFEQEWTSSALFFDPERNLWQLEELHTSPAVHTNRLDKISTIWLECENWESQLSFYRDVLKLPLVATGGGVRPVTTHTEQMRRAEYAETAASLGSTLDTATIPVQGQTKASVESVEVETLALNSQEQLETSLSGENPPAAVFFSEGTHLVLVPGGRKPPNLIRRVWGRDVNLSLSFQTYDVLALAQQLRTGGYTVTAPAPDPDTRRGLAFSFNDPEGNTWQVAEWVQTPV